MDQVFCRWFKTSWTWEGREEGAETLLELEGVTLGRWLDHPLVTTEVRPQDDLLVEWTAWEHGEVTLCVPCAMDAEADCWPSIGGDLSCAHMLGRTGGKGGLG